jgi:hypothetical protein
MKSSFGKRIGWVIDLSYAQVFTLINILYT